MNVIDGILKELRDLNKRINRLEIGPEQKIFTGSGSPEGVLTAPIGTLYLRTNGGAGTTLYVKESGVGNTGWVGK